METPRETVSKLLNRQIRVPVSTRRFDPHLARIDTAVKSIWQLFRWERWELLESLGVERAVYEPIFHRFDAENITSDHGLIDSPVNVNRLLKMCGPRLVARAVEVIERYQMTNKISRQAHYTPDRNETQI